MPSGKSRLAARRNAAAQIIAHAERMVGKPATLAAPDTLYVPVIPLRDPGQGQGFVSIPLLSNAADYERFRRGELYPVSSLFPPDPM